MNSERNRSIETHPRASIIIVSYNACHETTAPCIESILRETSLPEYEIIVVDNNSNDGTREHLERLSAEDRRITLIANRTNRGFAGGNNDGINIARGEYLVLLNSDTQVTEGWLSRLIELLESDRTIGLAGPVSNSVGNEQQIFTEGTTPVNIIREGMEWCRNSRGDTFRTDRLGFFCVAARKEVIDKVGLLDENFGLGFYEDDDYCIRVRNAGYSLVCTEDVFIYHQGGASFDTTPGVKQDLGKKNRALLEQKHDIIYRSRPPRDKQMDVIKLYIDTIREKGLTPILSWKLTNRFRLLRTTRPSAPLKRVRFEWRMAYLRFLLRSASRHR